MILNQFKLNCKDNLSSCCSYAPDVPLENLVSAKVSVPCHIIRVRFFLIIFICIYLWRRFSQLIFLSVAPMQRQGRQNGLCRVPLMCGGVLLCLVTVSHLWDAAEILLHLLHQLDVFDHLRRRCASGHPRVAVQKNKLCSDGEWLWYVRDINVPINNCIKSI